MPSYPYFGFPFFRRNFPYKYNIENQKPNINGIHSNLSSPITNSTNDYVSNALNKTNFKDNNNDKNENLKSNVKYEYNTKEKISTNNSSYLLDLFGLKLYFDDILLICLIFFLCNEGVKDDELFIALILLLLT